MITFNADEIFKMAEQIERNGAKFYRVAADSAISDARDLFLRLAEMEVKHEKTFAAMRHELSDEERRYTAHDPDNHAARYLQAMLYGKGFNLDPSGALGGKESIEDILNTAIGLEKDSVVFYQSMKEVVPRTAGKDKLDAIINEEIGHIVILRNQLQALKE